MVEGMILFTSQKPINISLDAISNSDCSVKSSRKSPSPLDCVKDSLDGGLKAAERQLVYDSRDHHTTNASDDLYGLSPQGRLTLQAVPASQCKRSAPPHGLSDQPRVDDSDKELIRNHRDHSLTNSLFSTVEQEAAHTPTMPLPGSTSALTALRAKRDGRALELTMSTSPTKLPHGTETSERPTRSEKLKPLAQGGHTIKPLTHISKIKTSRRAAMSGQNPTGAEATQISHSAIAELAALNEPDCHDSAKSARSNENATATKVGKTTAGKDRASGGALKRTAKRKTSSDTEGLPLQLVSTTTAELEERPSLDHRIKGTDDTAASKPQAVNRPDLRRRKVKLANLQFDQAETIHRCKQPLMRANDDLAERRIFDESRSMSGDHAQLDSNRARLTMTTKAKPKTLEDFENAVTGIGDNYGAEVRNRTERNPDQAKGILHPTTTIAHHEHGSTPKQRCRPNTEVGAHLSSVVSDQVRHPNGNAATANPSATDVDPRRRQEAFRTPARIRSSTPLNGFEYEVPVQPAEDAEPPRMTAIASDQFKLLNKEMRSLNRIQTVNNTPSDSGVTSTKPVFSGKPALRNEAKVSPSEISPHALDTRIVAPSSNVAADVNEALTEFLRKPQKAGFGSGRAHLNSSSIPNRAPSATKTGHGINDGLAHVGEIVDATQPHQIPDISFDQLKVRIPDKSLPENEAVNEKHTSFKETHRAPIIPTMLKSHDTAPPALAQAPKKRKATGYAHAIAPPLKIQKIVASDGIPSARNACKTREKNLTLQHASDAPVAHDADHTVPTIVMHLPDKVEISKGNVSDLPVDESNVSNITGTTGKHGTSSKAEDSCVPTGGATAMATNAGRAKKAARPASKNHVDIHGSPYPPQMAVPEQVTALEYFSRGNNERADDVAQRSHSLGLTGIQALGVAGLVTPHHSAVHEEVLAMPPILSKALSSIEKCRPASPDAVSRTIGIKGFRSTDPSMLWFSGIAPATPTDVFDSSNAVHKTPKQRVISSALHLKLQEAQAKIKMREKRSHSELAQFDDDEDPTKMLVDLEPGAAPRMKRSKYKLPTTNIAVESESSTPSQTELDLLDKWYEQLPPHLANVFDEAVSSFHRLTQWMLDQNTARQEMLGDYRRSMLSFVEKAEAKQVEEYQIALHKLNRLKKRKTKELEGFGKRLQASVAAVERERDTRQQGMKRSESEDPRLIAIRQRYG